MFLKLVDELLPCFEHCNKTITLPLASQTTYTLERNSNKQLGGFMPLMTWQDNFSVGVPSIDAQHKRLIELINELHQAMLDGAVPEKIKEILNGLIEYTQLHFSHEEKLFAEHEYPDAVAHKEIHDALVGKVMELKTKVDAGEQIRGMEVMEFLKSWLTGHILGEDKKYSAHFTSRNVQ